MKICVEIFLVKLKVQWNVHYTIFIIIFEYNPNTITVRYIPFTANRIAFDFHTFVKIQVSNIIMSLLIKVFNLWAYCEGGF